MFFIFNSEKSKGVYTAIFNADNLPSGVYFYSISIGNFTEVKKMVLLR
ncbi:MAG: T9SS type A sorting domain-containing protein [Bacteroidetes bacterium]|nr:T9SS type A sorting domain-containing protein [Bacteroidota bacterium]